MSGIRPGANLLRDGRSGRRWIMRLRDASAGRALFVDSPFNHLFNFIFQRSKQDNLPGRALEEVQLFPYDVVLRSFFCCHRYPISVYATLSNNCGSLAALCNDPLSHQPRSNRNPLHTPRAGGSLSLTEKSSSSQKGW